MVSTISSSSLSDIPALGQAVQGVVWAFADADQGWPAPTDAIWVCPVGQLVAQQAQGAPARDRRVLVKRECILKQASMYAVYIHCMNMLN